MDAPYYASARDSLDALRAGDISAVALLDQQLARFRQVNQRVNSVIRTHIDAARKQAQALDAMAARGEWAGPLHGLPMTVKDTLDVDGMPATAGAREYAMRDSRVRDADVVRRLKNAGAVIWGKSNTPYLAGDNQTFNAIHGVTNNPYDLTRTPGGSSGGSAAALAAGVTALEVGSDIGGSLRLPAHFCGVCALKPTWGVVPHKGHVPPAPGSVAQRDLNVIGPMARTVTDLKLLFSVMGGRAIAPGDGRLQNRRIAIWSEEDSYSLSADCGDAVARAAELARKHGAHVAKAKPDIDGGDLLDIYLQLLLATLSEDMSPRTLTFLELIRPLLKPFMTDKPFGRAKWSVYATARHRDWLKAHEAREKMKGAAASFFEKWDVIIAPVCAVSAFAHNQRGGALSRKMIVDGRVESYASFLSWISLATACHLPAAVIQAGWTQDALPVGVQIIGAHGQDDKVLDIALGLERALGGFRPPSL